MWLSDIFLEIFSILMIKTGIKRYHSNRSFKSWKNEPKTVNFEWNCVKLDLKCAIFEWKWVYWCKTNSMIICMKHVLDACSFFDDRTSQKWNLEHFVLQELSCILMHNLRPTPLKTTLTLIRFIMEKNYRSWKTHPKF